MKLAESGFDCILRTDTHRKGSQMNFVASRAAACCHLAIKGNSAEPSSQACGCSWVRRWQRMLVWLSSALPSGLDIPRQQQGLESASLAFLSALP